MRQNCAREGARRERRARRREGGIVGVEGVVGRGVDEGNCSEGSEAIGPDSDLGGLRDFGGWHERRAISDADGLLGFPK